MDETMGNQRLSYVYCSYDDVGRFYFGSRLCPLGVTPETDTDYLGSYTYSGFDPVGKTILLISDQHIVARNFETFLQLDFIRDPLCVNKAVFPLTGRSVLYPTKDPTVKKKLSDIRKTTPLSENQLKHLDQLNHKQKKENHPRADDKKYPFYNLETGDYFFGNVFELSEEKGVSLHEAHFAKTKFANSRRRIDSTDWTIASCVLSLDHYSYDTLFSFIHNDGETFEGTLKGLSKHTGIHQCSLEALLNKKIRYGWKLNDYSERK
jgi:hypothetical protein